jgi:hypothetical protein
MLVNRDAAVGVGRYADGIRPNPGNARAPAGCDEQPVARTSVSGLSGCRHRQQFSYGLHREMAS